MEANRWFRLLTLAVAAAAAALQCSGVGAELITVGGKQGWNPNVNYTTWVANQSFHRGDWLMFRFDKYMYDVMEVNQTSYEQCNPQGFIKNITRGGRDVFELNETRTYYFICSKGYCFGGMKAAIVVESEEPLTPAPSPNRNGADRHRLIVGRNHCVVMNVMLGFVIALALFFAL